ncbi:MAG TPA: flagellar hook-associated protein FlgL [Solirubrobacteraceae bacterium]|jgi:flagellar hook-associated protein 3 FlgL
MTDRITASMISSTTLHSIESSLAQLDHSSEELSSGKSILAPSDNPYGAGRAINLQSSLDGLSSYASNVQEAISWENTASGALSSIGSVVERVREVALQGQSGVDNEGDLQMLASQVEELAESVKQSANIQFGGSYIFSGSLTETAPYETGAEDAYHGNEGTIARAIAPGSTITISMSASTLLGEGGEDGKLLGVMREIASDLREATPASIAALSGAVEGLDTNKEALVSMQAHVGVVINQLQTAEGRIEELSTTTSAMLANTDGTNYAKVAIEYSSQQAGYEAALRAGGSIVQMSLLEFLR